MKAFTPLVLIFAATIGFVHADEASGASSAAPPASSAVKDRLITSIVFSDSPQPSPHIDRVRLLKGVKEMAWSTARVDALCDLLTERLRGQGYLVGRILATPADLAEARQSGRLRLTLFDGRLGQLILDNQSPASDHRLQRMASAALCNSAALDECHAPITARGIERLILLVGDLPAVAVEKPILQAGREANQTDVHLVTRKDGYNIIGTFTYDNFGNKGTGKNRYGVGVDLTNLLRLSDVISLSYNRTDEDQSGFNAALDVALGYNGLRGGMAVSRSTYTIGSAQGDLVAGNYASGLMQLNYPLVRASDVNNRIRFSVSTGHSKTNYLANSLQTRSDTRAATLLFSGDPSVLSMLRAPLTTSYFQWSFSINYMENDLDQDSRRIDEQTAQTQGDNWKLTYALLRKQNFDQAGYLSAIVSLRGQNALTGNMDGSQKMALGGPNSVRAYPLGEWGSDNAQLGSLDFRGTVPIDSLALSLSVFADWGRGEIYKQPWDDAGRVDNRAILYGFGTSFDLSGSLGSHLPFQAGVIYAKKGGGSRASAIDPTSTQQVWVYVRLNAL